jgi:hypothetical protein
MPPLGELVAAAGRLERAAGEAEPPRRAEDLALTLNVLRRVGSQV